ncbi:MULTISPECIES: xanthine dehydrogenase family protein subunit M [unclassified Streptomyces]|uniref:FAD binding domain-containing protein n=1 Tax=unclassified Streptomyces TaxID=2593676 RepID=UPI001BED32CE|nr:MULTISPECIES: FAD binding domain-containing protein [unclassified Streptomyces]MBT2407240.1 FAD binding domain-containing protein [Streptomyces sp. ISL-21]MBT2455652.1 FAD binding domain-containing protein [Streptomyces sp. ISL-86]MBT2612129.1 FAD binding domain-containing protein [Streptomyces sp. ISL-87]
MILTEFDYVRPVGLDEALTLLSGTPGARVLAGGQTLLPDLRTGADRAGLLVDIRHLEELRGIEAADGGLRIGALTTLAELAAHPLVLDGVPELAAAARSNGDPQVRNLGTAGGNLAAGGRATDLPVAAIAADAVVELAGPGGRSTVPAEELAASGVPVGSVVTALLVPAAGPAAAFEKTADRATRYPVCAAAVRITADGPRIAVTGATARALRLRGVEDRLRGGPYTTDAVLAAFRAEPRELFVPGRGTSAEYLGHLAGVLTARALARAAQALA